MNMWKTVDIHTGMKYAYTYQSLLESENQMDYFQRKYRVIAPDTRGHSKSPRGNAPFTIAQFACDLYSFMAVHR